MTDILWSNDVVIFKDGDVVWKSHETDIQAIFSSSSNVSGSLNSQPGLIDSIAGISSLSSSLNVATQLIGSLAATSNLSASLNVATQLISSLATVSNLSASLNVATQLISSATEISGASANLNSQPGAESSIAATISVSGILNVTTELGSLVVEISGASASLGSLGVLTLLVAPSDEISNVSGWLGFLIFVEGTSAGISEASASLDSQPGCEGLIIGASTLLGYLDLIPDFEAATLFWRPQDNIIETLEWKTEILKAKDGTEQRIKVRQSPRQYFKLRLYLESDKINTWYDSMIHTWQKQAWLIPIWTEYVKHTTDIDHHDTVIVVDTTNADFRNDSKAIIWKSSTEYEVIVIDTKTDSQLNLGYSVLNSFTGDKYIIPVRTAYIISSSNKEKYNSEISFVDLIFAIYDNDISIDEYVPDMQYDGYVVLNIPAFMDRTFTENSNADIIITDFETGIFKVESYSNFNFLTQTHNFLNDTKKECWDFRKFLYSLNGRQKTILIPTFRDDVIQTDNILVLDTSVKIENIDLAENMAFNSLRIYIGFYFPNGTLIIRKITGISGPTESEPTKEQIDFDANLGLSFIVEPEDCKICFVDKCRLASDSVEIQWPYTHRNECRTNFVRIP